MAEAQTKTLAGKNGVLGEMAEHPAVKALLGWKQDGLVDAKFDRGELTLAVSKEDIAAALLALQAGGYNFFEDMTAVDWYPSIPRFQLSYHILSHARKERVRLRTMVDESDAVVQSITSIWPGANYYE